MSMYYKGNLISGVREVPKMTLAQYNALTNKPKLWIRTDAPDSDRGITASDVEYSTGVSVEDKIDAIGGTMYSKTISATTDSSGNITTGLSANEYIYIGTTGSSSLFYIPLNALSDGKIRIRVLDATNMNPVTNVPINQPFFFWKIG